MRIASEQLEQLWYENEAGDRFVPCLDGDMPPDIPEGFYAQHATFVCHLNHEVNIIITAEDVAACDHPADMMLKETDLVETHEGRKCRKCGGYQERLVGQEWGADWASGHSLPAGGMTSTWQPDLVLAMTRSTTEERDLQARRWNPHQAAVQVGAKLEPHPPYFDLEGAIIISARACERCTNVLYWTYGVTFSDADSGYPEMSDEWKRCGTSCAFCEHMGHIRQPDPDSIAEAADSDVAPPA